MTDLLDIAPELLRETVGVAGKQIEVCGIPLVHFAKILRRFPELNALGVETAGSPGAAASALDLMAPVIAAGVGHAGEVAYEEAASRLTIDDQMSLFNAIMRLTMPEPERASPLVASAASSAANAIVPAAVSVNGSLSP